MTQRIPNVLRDGQWHSHFEVGFLGAHPDIVRRLERTVEFGRPTSTYWYRSRPLDSGESNRVRQPQAGAGAAVTVPSPDSSGSRANPSDLPDEGDGSEPLDSSGPAGDWAPPLRGAAEPVVARARVSGPVSLDESLSREVAELNAEFPNMLIQVEVKEAPLPLEENKRRLAELQTSLFGKAAA